MARRKKREHDINVTAFRVVQEAAGEDQGRERATDQELPLTEGKNPHAVALGRIGGKKGGEARAKSLAPERRKAIAKKAAAARWRKQDREA